MPAQLVMAERNEAIYPPVPIRRSADLPRRTALGNNRRSKVASCPRLAAASASR